MHPPPFRLTVFGPPRLDGLAGIVANSGPRRHALLAIVSASGTAGVTRDRVLGLLWPDADQDRARHNLNQTLYALRRDTKAELIAGTTELRLDPSVCAADIVAFDTAIAEGRPADALAVYAGPLLDGAFLADAPAFAHWLDGERDRRARQATVAAEAVATASERDADPTTAVAAWRRVAALDPLSGRVAERLMRALVRAGDRGGALRHAEQHTAFLARELETTPDAQVVALADELRGAAPAPLPAARVQVVPPAPIASPPAPPIPPRPTPASVAAAPSPAPTPRHTRRRNQLRAVAAVVAGLVVIAAPRRSDIAYAEGDYIVLGDFVNLSRDTLLSRTAGAAFAAALGQSRHVAMLPRPRIASALRRMRRPDTTSLLDPVTAREVAIREQVQLVVTGEILEVGGELQVVTHVTDAATGRDLRTRSRRIADRGELLDALDALGADVRRDLGDARTAVAAAVPLPKVTTSSLEALRLYDDAERAKNAADLGRGMDRLTAAVAADSDFAQARSALGALLVYLNRPREAEPHFAAATRLAEHLPPSEALPISAQVNASRGRWSEAIAAMRSYLALHPQDAEKWVRLGGYLRRARRTREALAAFDSAAARVPLEAGDELAIAALWADESRRVSDARAASDSARAHYERAFALDSTLRTYAYVNHQYGEALVALGMIDSARAVFRQMLDRPPNDRARGLRSLGYLAAWEGRFTTASRLFADAASVSTAERQWTSAVRSEALAGAVLVHAGRASAGLPALRHAAATGRAHDGEMRLMRYVVAPLAQGGDAANAAELVRWMRGAMLGGDALAASIMQEASGNVLVAQRRGVAGRDSLAMAMRGDSSTWTRALLAGAEAAAGDLQAAVRRYEEVAPRFSFGGEEQFMTQLAPYWIGRHREQLGELVAAKAAYARFVRSFAPTVPAEELPLAVADARRRLAALEQRP
jgi:DNA-binding SARP family transcriptional activator